MLYLPSLTMYPSASCHMNYVGKCCHLHGEEFKLVKPKAVDPPTKKELP